jgi:pyridoxamine 5'-phosphate oxidase
MSLFWGWLEEETAAKRQPNPNAMCLATVGDGGDGGPRARIVLCRGVEVGAGYVVFYTNYQSDKGRELAANPRAAATFHWDHSERQVRLEGVVVKSPAAESDAYFGNRPKESRLSAWASNQSRPIESRAKLVEQYERVVAERGGGEVARPPHWGGYRLWLTRVELWVGGVGRLHDRAAWVRGLTAAGDGFVGGAWAGTRLQP